MVGRVLRRMTQNVNTIVRFKPNHAPKSMPHLVTITVIPVMGSLHNRLYGQNSLCTTSLLLVHLKQTFQYHHVMTVMDMQVTLLNSKD